MPLAVGTWWLHLHYTIVDPLLVTLPCTELSPYPVTSFPQNGSVTSPITVMPPESPLEDIMQEQIGLNKDRSWIE